MLFFVFVQTKTQTSTQASPTSARLASPPTTEQKTENRIWQKQNNNDQKKGIYCLSTKIITHHTVECRHEGDKMMVEMIHLKVQQARQQQQQPPPPPAGK